MRQEVGLDSRDCVSDRKFPEAANTHLRRFLAGRECPETAEIKGILLGVTRSVGRRKPRLALGYVAPRMALISAPARR